MCRSQPELSYFKNNMTFQKIFWWLKQSGYLQSITMGILAGIGFVVPALWWCGLIAIMWMIQVLMQQPPMRKVLVPFVIVWITKSLLSLIWVWYVYPIEWISGLGNGSQLVLIGAYWLSGALWLSSGGAVFGYLSLLLIRQTHWSNIFKLAMLPLLWTLSEILAAGLFSVFTAGPGSFIQSYFSVGMMGYLLATTSFGIWIAAIGHVYVLSIAMVSIAVGLYVVQRVFTCVQSVGIAIATICVIAYVNVPIVDTVNLQQTVISIDTQFDSKLLATDEGNEIKDENVREAVAEAMAVKPDVVILPEDTRYLSTNFPETRLEQVKIYWQLRFPNNQTLVIDSGRFTNERGETFSRANVFDTVNNTIWQFDKQYLVPQGEYIPTLYGGILRLFGFGRAVDKIALDSSYQPGPLLQTSALPSNLPGVLFCFESMSPQGISSLRAVRPIPFVAHPVSHSWFHSPTILRQQLDVMLQVQARFNGVPIVSAGNMTTGKMYLPNGKIESGTVIHERERYLLRLFTF